MANTVPAEQNDDLVQFFKHAINSPPEVEHFIASQAILGPRELPPALAAELRSKGAGIDQPPQPYFFEGASSGDNFFLIDRTNAVQGTGSFDGMRFVTGRSGSNSFQVGINALRLTSENANLSPENPVARWSEANQGLLKQLLQMGVGGLKVGSVRWRSNQFEGESTSGIPIFGELAVSNGLPSDLRLSSTKGGIPYNILSYVYPVPPAKLGGFPRTMRSVRGANEIHPRDEFTIYDLRIAKTPLSEAFFDSHRFTTHEVQWTNIFSNRSYYALASNRLVRMPAQAAAKLESASKLKPSIARFCLLTVALAPFFAVFLWKSLKPTSNKKPK
jgi:hypothetical protein